jgi:hypothetical protein
LSRRAELERRQIKLLGVQAAIFLVLALALVPIQINISIPIISSLQNTKGLKEIFLIVSAGLSLYGSIGNGEATYLSELIKTRIEKLTKGDADAAATLRAAYGLGSGDYII